MILAAFQRCVEHGEPYGLELPFTTAKGRRLWIRTTAEAVLDWGRVVKVAGNIMDITTGLDGALLTLFEQTKDQRCLDFCVRSEQYKLAEWNSTVKMDEADKPYNMDDERHAYIFISLCVAQLQLYKLQGGSNPPPATVRQKANVAAPVGGGHVIVFDSRKVIVLLGCLLWLFSEGGEGCGGLAVWGGIDGNACFDDGEYFFA